MSESTELLKQKLRDCSADNARRHVEHAHALATVSALQVELSRARELLTRYRVAHHAVLESATAVCCSCVTCVGADAVIAGKEP